MSQSEDRTGSRFAEHALAGMGFLAALALAAIIWRFGPAGRIAVHFDLYGRPNGWMDRPQVAIVTAGLTACFAVGYTAMGLLTGRVGRNLRIARLVIVLVAVMTAVIMAGSTFGALNSPDLSPTRLQPAILSLLFLIVGALIGKASPNPLVGVRTYWSLRSRLAWDKSNRLAGRLFFGIGALGLAASAFAPPPSVIAAVLVAVILSAIIAVVESWRVWRTDPDRRWS